MTGIITIFTLIITSLSNPVKVNDSSPLPWFKGEIPETPNNTVLVFVHGKHDDETIWFGNVHHYGHNNMYEQAYNAGYRTAFVRLGAEASMWYNGRVLAKQLENIEQYYNTRNIVIIAHSKGGVDAQTALVYYNALGAPRKLITLSTPYYGSPLADLLFSNVYITWLALIIGQATPAAFVLQTAYMYDFQQRLLNKPFNEYLYYYTMSGWDWGPFPTFLGGMYLALHGGSKDNGGNDGAVTYESAHLITEHAHRISLPAYADSQKQWYLNHFNIRLGQNTWVYIDSILNTYPVIPAMAKEKTKNRYITLKSTGYIESSISKNRLSTNLQKGTSLLIITYNDAKTSLNERNLHLSSLKNNIQYLKTTIATRSQLKISGEYFLIANERSNPLYVTYKPVIADELPYIIMRTPFKNLFNYKLNVKVYSLSGVYKRDIVLSGKTKNNEPVYLPFYEKGLYNISLRVNYGNTLRNLIFTMIVNPENQHQRKQNIQTTSFKSVENLNMSSLPLYDILGRRTISQKSGVFFIKEARCNKPIIVIK